MLTLNFPVNSTSLGASAFHILENVETPFHLFPIGGGLDMSGFEPVPAEKIDKLTRSMVNALENHVVTNPAVRLWHHFASFERVSNKQILYTFHEVDALTKCELNALNQQDHIIVPCTYNQKVFTDMGVKPPISVVPLGVDRSVFYPLEKHANKTGPYIFVMAGKFEARKLHLETLQAFVSIFGNNPNVKLRCCVSNRFVDMKRVYGMISERVFQNKPPTNIEFIDWLPTERDVADFFSHADCLISPSRAESFNLPLLQAMSCGIQVITNKDHAHADYVNENNAILVPNEGMVVARDDTFFKNDGRTNTGKWFNVSTNAIASAMIEAYKRGRSVNNNGIETSKQFSWKTTATEIIKIWDTFQKM